MRAALSFLPRLSFAFPCWFHVQASSLLTEAPEAPDLDPTRLATCHKRRHPPSSRMHKFQNESHWPVLGPMPSPEPITVALYWHPGLGVQYHLKQVEGDWERSSSPQRKLGAIVKRKGNGCLECKTTS